MRPLAAFAGVAWIATAGCRVDQQEFNNRVFTCNVASPDPGCGTDETGRAMACFAARQIGATDFCAKTCDIEAPGSVGLSTAEGAVCLKSGMSSGIELSACNPADDDPAINPTGVCRERGLRCYRTDLLSDEGVCTTMSPCNADTDCRDPVRSVCVTSFLASLYAQGTALKRDHLFCMQTGCRAGNTSCSPGETCLQNVIPAAAHPPDICVPNCDSNLRCPPNFLCYRRVSTSIAPSVCIPGLLGFTCDDAVDCMLGRCVDTTIGYKVCTTDCETHADCQQFDGDQGKFLCIKNPGNPTEPGVCQTPDAYRGSICNTTADCLMRNPDEICAQVDPTNPSGTCLLPCAPDGRCLPRVGINHTCVPSGVDGSVPVCFPGYFGFPCAGDINCTGDLTCHETIPGQPSICTMNCETNADCAGDRWIGADGFCSGDLKICLSKIDDGGPCPSDDACRSGECADLNTCPAGVTPCCASTTGGRP
jgi:hypothetical protein